MEENNNERLVLFTDAVIAITITLLVLELRLPEGFAKFSDAELWAELVSMWPRFLAYMISFLVIAVFWQNHHQKFGHINGNSRWLTWLNFLFLMFVSLIPFTTAVIAENGGSVATIIYAANIFAVSVMLIAVSLHAEQAGLVDVQMTPSQRRRAVVQMSMTAAVFALSIPIAMVWPDLAKFFWLLLIPIAIAKRVASPDS